MSQFKTSILRLNQEIKSIPRSHGLARLRAWRPLGPSGVEGPVELEEPPGPLRQLLLLDDVEVVLLLLPLAPAVTARPLLLK